MSAYYNENDPFAAQWLRELIKMGDIAPGYVDERSIEDVTPADLKGFTQHHFFAGVGAWSYALRLAGWPDNRPVWTGSCPCQPFSSAGKGAGFNDERHLWPAFAWLIKQHGPAEVFGEQVASSATNPWFDLVQVDLENMGYAFGCVPFPAASVGAPHIRDRAYWVANSTYQGPSQFSGKWHQPERFTANGTALRLADSNSEHKRPTGDTAGFGNAGRSSEIGGMANNESQRWNGLESATGLARGIVTEANSATERLGNADSNTAGRLSGAVCKSQNKECDRNSSNDASASSSVIRTGPVNGFWSDADWLFCRDGKWRPVEPGTFPLVNGAPARVGRLRGYGNAIVAEEAAQFIRAYLSATTVEVSK